MGAGKGTFIDDMLSACGLQNALSETRYPIFELDQLGEPELVLLSSEPYPFKEKDIEEIKNRFETAKILLVDGEMFSWYGSRLLKAPKYFQTLIDSI